MKHGTSSSITKKFQKSRGQPLHAHLAPSCEHMPFARETLEHVARWMVAVLVEPLVLSAQHLMQANTTVAEAVQWDYGQSIVTGIVSAVYPLVSWNPRICFFGYVDTGKVRIWSIHRRKFHGKLRWLSQLIVLCFMAFCVRAVGWWDDEIKHKIKGRFTIF